MNTRKTISYALCLIVLAPLAASAMAQQQGTAPLYTNEDLKALPPLPVQKAPIAEPAPADWAATLEMIDRSYARIDADRAYQLQRDIVERQWKLAKEFRNEDDLLLLNPWGWNGGLGIWSGGGLNVMGSHRPRLLRPGSD